MSPKTLAAHIHEEMEIEMGMILSEFLNANSHLFSDSALIAAEMLLEEVQKTDLKRTAPQLDKAQRRNAIAH